MRLITFDDPGDGQPAEPAAERLLAGAPRQRVWNLHSDVTGQFHAGRWASTAGAWRVHYTETEFCHLLQGRVRIRSADGASWDFGPGDAFVVPAGFAGTWEVVEDAVKLYAIFEPAAPAPWEAPATASSGISSP
jgi:uncharacterized cupin superfamily protein